MKKKHLYISLIIAAVAIYYTFRNVSLKELSTAISSMHFIYMVPALVFYILYYYLRAIRWKYLILSIKEVDEKRLISPLVVGLMANLLPARLGELVRAYLLGKQENIPFSSSFATIVIERVFDLIIILAMFGSIFIFQADVMSDTNLLGGRDILGKMIMFGWFSLFFVFALISLSLLLIYRQELVISWVKYFCRPLPEKIEIKSVELLSSFTEGLQVLKDLKTTIVVMLLSGAVWIVSMVSYYPFYYAFDIDYLPFSSVIILFVIICIFIAILPTPGFIGSFQAACMVGLHNIFGVPEAIAASFGIITWAFTMGITVVAGIYFIIKDNISMKEIKESYT